MAEAKGCGRACMGEPPPHQLGGDISAGQGQRSRGTTAERGPARTDDTCRGVLQQGQRVGDPELLDRIDERRQEGKDGTH